MTVRPSTSPLQDAARDARFLMLQTGQVAQAAVRPGAASSWRPRPDGGLLDARTPCRGGARLMRYGTLWTWQRSMAAATPKVFGRFAIAFAPSTMNSRQRRIEPPGEEIGEQGRTTDKCSPSPTSTTAEACRRCHRQDRRHQDMVADMQSVDLDDSAELREVRGEPGLHGLARQRHKGRETATSRCRRASTLRQVIPRADGPRWYLRAARSVPSVERPLENLPLGNTCQLSKTHLLASMVANLAAAFHAAARR